MAKKNAARSTARPRNNAKPTIRVPVAGAVKGKSAKAPKPKGERTVQRPGIKRLGTLAVESGRLAVTLKERVEQALNQSEPIPTAPESDAVRFAISKPGLLDEVREQAFVELAGVVERKLAEHGHHLTPSEAANVAWWIVGHPDDVPDA